jgi:hypothetical protein
MEKRKQESGYHVRKLLIAHLLLLTPFASARGFTKKKKVQRDKKCRCYIYMDTTTGKSSHARTTA